MNFAQTGSNLLFRSNGSIWGGKVSGGEREAQRNGTEPPRTPATDRPRPGRHRQPPHGAHAGPGAPIRAVGRGGRRRGALAGQETRRSLCPRTNPWGTVSLLVKRIFTPVAPVGLEHIAWLGSLSLVGGS